MGSIRILFRNPDVTDHFRLKQIAPDVPVFANIGGVQLRERKYDKLVELIRRLEVDAIAVHLNPGQELAQPEGDRNFAGIRNGIAGLCDASPVPVIVKEAGFGIAPDEARVLIGAGTHYVDVAGGGGTNWMTVEGHRQQPAGNAAAFEFADWGTPTAALLDASRELRGRILASGGIRTGMDVAKSVALGAVSAGMALPFIRAVARDGVDGGLALVRRVAEVLRTAMVLTGCLAVDQLQRIPLLRTQELDRVVAELSALDRI
jgi:isopentenyl-diphosphate delta-isomerase type 2